MPIAPDRLFEIVADLARRPGHEAVRTGVSTLLTEGLGAELHAIRHELRVVEARGRIDALLGRTVLEFKSNLARERADALEELSRYLPEREAATGQRFVGVVTDGLKWEAYELRGGAPFLLRGFKTDARKPDGLLAWLDGAVAARAEIPATPSTSWPNWGPAASPSCAPGRRSPRPGRRSPTIRPPPCSASCGRNF
ncbi:MAG: hypothetical protein ACR2FH_08855 [Caulobacteraceae bacterium]